MMTRSRIVAATAAMFCAALLAAGCAQPPKEVTVGELPTDQALELLGRWTNQDPEVLPYGARDLCSQAGNLALGVALAGGMAAQARCSVGSV